MLRQLKAWLHRWTLCIIGFHGPRTGCVQLLDYEPARRFRYRSYWACRYCRSVIYCRCGVNAETRYGPDAGRYCGKCGCDFEF